MSKRETQVTKHSFFCDICNNEIYDSRDDSASELTKKCIVCKRDTCPDCRTYPDLIHDHYNEACLCTNCSSINKDTLNQIKQNHEQYITAYQKTESEYLRTEDKLKKQLKAKE
jgi:hypothetical protein